MSFTLFKSDKLLLLSAKIWFITAAIGQWIFGIYVFLFYHRSAVMLDFAKWNKVLPSGYIKGDMLGNLYVALHVLLGGVIIIGGPLQFVPYIQRKYRLFHRWLGRIYITAAVIIGLAGLLMVWVRGSVGDTFMHVSISISAVYLFIFAILTIKNARAKKFIEHRKWALRLFMIANGGWFFRIGLMGWILINGGPVGIDRATFTGPAIWIISVLSYSVPLAIIILELYLYALKRKSNLLSLTTTLLIFIATIFTLIGITAATIFSWYPRAVM